MTNQHIAVATNAPDGREDAAFWFARLRSDDCGEKEQAQFEAWLAADPAREQEYYQYCAVWSKLGELAEEPEIVQIRLKSLAQLPDENVKNRWRLQALAASVLIMLALGFAVPGLIGFAQDPEPTEKLPSLIASKSADPIAPQPAANVDEAIELATSYRTEIGEHSKFTLPDGSIIELNTNSRVRVTYTKDRRDFVLLRGEAIFRVAKNKQRPFVVLTNDNRVTALGTVFSVRLDAEQTIVTLLEGSVKVEQFERESGAAAVEQITTLVAGQQLLTSKNNGHQVRYSDIKAASSWAKGRLYFDNRRLGEVIHELNRYTTKRLVLADSNLADMRISGQFRISSADSFAQTLAASFPVKASEDSGSGQVILSAQ